MDQIRCYHENICDNTTCRQNCVNERRKVHEHIGWIQVDRSKDSRL